MRIQIIRIERKDYPGHPYWEELYINGDKKVSYPGLLPGNEVAHSIVQALKREGRNDTYEIIER